MRMRQALALGVKVAAQGGAPSPASPGSLLVVSPSRAIQAQMETHLQKDGVRVQGAPTLEEALQLIQQGAPDAIAVDLAMGQSEVLDWVVRVRALPGMAALPVLVLAAKAEENGLDALEGHVQDRLTKPLDGQEGRHRVNLLLRIARM